eukprot:2565670-Prymnesium_polylepis.1
MRQQRPPQARPPQRWPMPGCHGGGRARGGRWGHFGRRGRGVVERGRVVSAVRSYDVARGV